MKYPRLFAFFALYNELSDATDKARLLGNQRSSLLSEESIIVLKKKQHLKENIELDLHLINKDDNIINFNGKEFSLDDVEPVNVFTPNATYMHNGDYLPIPDDLALLHTTLVGNSKSNGDTIFIQKDASNGEVKSISIIEGHDGSYHSILPGILVISKAEHRDDYKDNSFIPYSSGYHDGDVDSSNENKLLLQTNKTSSESIHYPRKLQTCTEYRVIEVALAYDSTFCAEYGPDQASADQEAKDILAGASTLYKAQGICAKLTLSHLEGFCSSINDPFATMISSTGSIGCPNDPSVVTEFGQWVLDNRASVTKDTFHLLIFETQKVTQDKFGCANQDKMCVTNGNPHGVENMAFSIKSEQFRRSAILAHEIGHNLGTDHVNVVTDNLPVVANQDYIMDKDGVGFGTHIWSPQNLNILQTNIPNRNCLAVEAATNSGISDNGNAIWNIDGQFLIKSWFNNLCLNIPQSNTTGNPVLRMYRCHGSNNQLWEMDSLGHIHSALDYNKCVGLPGPSTRPRTVPGTALQLYDCVAGEITQLWYWNSNGRKLKSQWRTKRCLTTIWKGGKAKVNQCERGDKTQWFFFA